MMVIYGAIFTEQQIESVLTDAQKAEILYTRKNIDCSYEIYQMLMKIDDRFSYKSKKIINTVYTYGIPLEAIKDEEMFGEFKKQVQDALIKVFKKHITAAFYEIEEDIYE